MSKLPPTHPKKVLVMSLLPVGSVIGLKCFRVKLWSNDLLRDGFHSLEGLLYFLPNKCPVE